VVEDFPKFIWPNKTLQRAQVFDRSIRHHMSEEVHRVGQSVDGFLKPHDALRHGQQGWCHWQGFHGVS
jgi:hypothetical protein